MSYLHIVGSDEWKHEYRSPYFRRGGELTLPYDKILLPYDAIAFSLGCRNKGVDVLVVDGTFDIVQYRHPEFLFACKQLVPQGILIVRIGSDKHIKDCKNADGRVVPLDHSQRQMSFYPFVDIITHKDDPGLKWISDYMPSHIVASTTSGRNIMDWFADFDEQNTCGAKLTIFDEHMMPVRRRDAVAKAIEYDATKFTKGKVSGSVYKAEIIRRAVGK